MTKYFDILVKTLKKKEFTEEQKILITELILDKDPNIVQEKECSNHNMTILHYAVYINSSKIIRYLLERGADPMARDSIGNLPIHHTIKYNFSPQKAFWKVVKVFLDHGVDVNISDFDKNTVLHYAVLIGNLEIISELIEEYKACVNVGNNVGETPLHCAAENGSIEIVNKLIEYGSNTKIGNEKNGLTLLHSAALGGNIEIVKKFLNGIDLNIERNCSLPLHYVHYGSLHYDKIIKMFCGRGVDLNALDNDQDTALLLSILHCKTEAVEYLLSHGADVNNKRLARYKEACEGEFEIEKELYNALIDKIDFASDSRYLDIFELIALHIAKLEAAKLEISKSNLQLQNEFKNSILFIERENQYKKHFEKCKEEVKRLKEADILLYDFLKEDDNNKQINIWIRHKGEKVQQNGKRQKVKLNMKKFKEEMKSLYPEYSGIMIYKINQIEKEIFTRNNKPLIGALSQHYGWYGLQNISSSDLAMFLIDNKDDLMKKLRESGLISDHSIDVIDHNDSTLAYPYSLRTLAAAQYVRSSKLDSLNVQQIGSSILSKRV
ncbi:ankyrin repeat domain-containing protein [Candidatus Mesenet endosymbiont of Agriotes lineatus]|uniref:ankyrin repeat domain-containing protein n=1 Tax=Candidatus Mesenet endosymbiont of Agriotes lineatus TaxID=3077948 RepID=UPI0030CC7DD9